MSASLKAQSLFKSFGEVSAVRDFNHHFLPGAVTVILGPSGSGKSTLLSMLIGLTQPDWGRIALGGQDITHIPPEKRDFGFVFQNYKLFPHLSVVENVEFGLRVRAVDRHTRRARAMDALEMVRIPGLADRRVHQISGGEQQRVALARALAFQPRVLLLDEPLSALDAKLRESLRAELPRLFGELSVTTIFVTHDQTEAMTLGRELIIMNQGGIEQAGPPLALYSRPATAFAATFLGCANLLDAACSSDAGPPRLHLKAATLAAPENTPSGPCLAMVRPEDICVVADGEGQLRGRVVSSLFLGSLCRLTVDCDGQEITVDAPGDAPLPPGPQVCLRIREDRLRILPPRGRDTTWTR
jgi:putative spermidine/putrescine transport system ATP-binding protein